MEVQEEGVYPASYYEQLKANASFTQSFLTCTQHIFLISKNALNSGNKNPELKIIYSKKINPKVIIEF